jgi:hypothetical protein
MMYQTPWGQSLTHCVVYTHACVSPATSTSARRSAATSACTTTLKAISTSSVCGYHSHSSYLSLSRLWLTHSWLLLAHRRSSTRRSSRTCSSIRTQPEYAIANASVLQRRSLAHSLSLSIFPAVDPTTTRWGAARLHRPLPRSGAHHAHVRPPPPHPPPSSESSALI